MIIKKALIFLELLLLATTARSQDLTIWLNTNDCINCISSLGLVKDIDPNVVVSIACDEAEQRFIPALLTQFGLEPNDHLAIQYISTSHFKKLAPDRARCEFRTDRSTKLDFPLAELGAHMPIINALSHSFLNTTKIPLPRTMPISDNPIACISGNRIAIADLTLRKAYTITLSSKDTAQIDEVVLSNRWKREYLTLIGLDTLQYDSFEVALRKWNMYTPRITAMAMHEDSLFLLVDVRYPNIEPTQILIGPYTALVTMVADKVVDTWRLDWDLEPFVANYLTSIEEGFAINGTTVTLPVIPFQTDTDSIHLLAEYERNKNISRFRRMLPVASPSEFLKHGATSHYPSSRFANDLYIFRAYPFFVDLKSQSVIDLARVLFPDRGMEFFKDQVPQYWAWDAQRVGSGNLMIFFSWKNTQWVAWVDLVTGQLLRQEKINTNDMVLETVQFRDDGSLIGFSKNYDALIIKK